MDKNSFAYKLGEVVGEQKCSFSDRDWKRFNKFTGGDEELLEILRGLPASIGADYSKATRPSRRKLITEQYGLEEEDIPKLVLDRPIKGTAIGAGVGLPGGLLGAGIGGGIGYLIDRRRSRKALVALAKAIRERQQ